MTQLELTQDIEQLKKHVGETASRKLYRVAYDATRDDLKQFPQAFHKLLADEFYRQYQMVW